MKRCVYCGFPAQCRDHVPPRAWSSVYRTKKGTVASCHECNRLLNDVPLLTIRERAEYLRGRYEIHGAKWLAKRDWSAKELAAFPFVVQTEIKAGLAKREHYRNKLRNLGALPEERPAPAATPEPQPLPEPQPTVYQVQADAAAKRSVRRRRAKRQRLKRERQKQERKEWLSRWWGLDA